LSTSNIPSDAAAKKKAVQDELSSEKRVGIIIAKELSQYLWPPASNPESANIKMRVVASLSLLGGSKLINVCVPFLFKDIIDSLAVFQETGALSQADSLFMAGPLAMVLGYGIARSSSSGFNELKNTIFSVVASGTITKISRDLFVHLHKLDMQFHLDRNTGTLSRVIDRGTRSINFVLNSMLFNVFPTALEVGLVSAILAAKLGPAYAAVAVGTIAAYTTFTVRVSDWRTEIRRRMNQAETAASGRVVDSLINYETVKLFGNERHEAERYSDALEIYKQCSLRTQSSLSMLNFGQNAIFSVGLTAMMYMASQGLLNGT
jgi:ABC-type multidrug transport system fused ATPase/permease subunit